MKILWLPFGIFLLFRSVYSLDYYVGDSALPPIQDLVVGEATTVKPPFLYLDASPEAIVACTRLRVNGLSRLRKIDKYAHSYRVKIEASVPQSKLSIEKVEICFHWNKTLGACECSKDQWKGLEKGSWSGMMSPFETRFIDIRITNSHTGTSFNASAIDEFWPYRLVFLGAGFALLLLAPIVSSWVPFYYSSAMTLGILLVVLILLYQGMKLLPTGRKSTLYIILYGSVVGMGTVVVRYFTGFLSSVLRELGLSDEMYNPVAVFLLLSIILMGAWLGYWGVRKLVLSEDGTVDYGTAQFVKWALRLIGSIMMLQSSHDSVFASLSLITGIVLPLLIKGIASWAHDFYVSTMLSPRCYSFKTCMVRRSTIRKAVQGPVRAESFQTSDEMLLKSQTNALGRSSPILSHGEGALTARSLESLPPRYLSNSQEFYSTFHQTPGSKGISNADFDSITEECTKKAVTQLVASPKFAEWALSHSDRIMVRPYELREERPEEEIQRTAEMDEPERKRWRLFW